MKIVLQKAKHPRFTTSTSYAIKAIMPETEKGDGDEELLIGYVTKSHWGRGPHDGTRWDFSGPDGTASTSALAQSSLYPSTLRQAKAIIYAWIAKLLVAALKPPFEDVRRGSKWPRSHEYLAMPDQVKPVDPQ